MSTTEINGRIIPSAYEAKMYSLEELWRYASYPTPNPFAFGVGLLTDSGLAVVGWQPLQPKKEFRFSQVVRAYLFGRVLVGLHEIHSRKPVKRLQAVLLYELHQNWLNIRLTDYEPVDSLLQPFESILSESDFGWLQKQLRLVEKRIDFEDGQPVRLYPLTRDVIADSPRMIVLDPEIRYGRPTLSGYGLTTKVLLERFLGGDSISKISPDFEIRPEEMEEVIRYEARHPEQLTFDFRQQSE